jgi:hypothetical protein
LAHSLCDLASSSEPATRAQQLALRLRSLRARVLAGALKLIEMLGSAVEVARAHKVKLGKLGLGAELESQLVGTLELLEGALSSGEHAR